MVWLGPDLIHQQEVDNWLFEYFLFYSTSDQAEPGERQNNSWAAGPAIPFTDHHELIKQMN